MGARVIPVSPFTLVVFGATGDLARRKLYPALWRRFAAGQMPPEARVIGVARGAVTDARFRAMVKKSIAGAGALAPGAKGVREAARLQKWLAGFQYACVDALADDDAEWNALSRMLQAMPRPHVFYLAVAPALAQNLCARLHAGGFLKRGARLVLEKPFGHDLKSARKLNAAVQTAADESRIYRIDHYLGKETVQNLMALRFANALFEPVWNAACIDHVQITVAEQIGVGGRGEYYDAAGAVRDMLQNHLLQLLCLAAMEPPARYAADDVRDQKMKTLRSLRPPSAKTRAVFGQYAAGKGMPSYRDDAGRRSRTETFAAVRCEIDNWRWAGTPFYLRTGKRLRARMSEIAVCFKRPPHSIFPGIPSPPGNTLAVRLQPQEGVTMHLNIKDPGPGGFRLDSAALDMSFADTLGSELPDAYERLLMDVVRGDQTLFMRADELEAAWEWAEPLMRRAERGTPSLYPCGSDGPAESAQLMQADGRTWRPIV